MITEIIIGVSLALLLWFLILKWYNHYQLNKIRRTYNDEENFSREGQPRELGTSGGERTFAGKIQTDSIGERDVQRNEQFGKRKLLPVTSISSFEQDGINAGTEQSNDDRDSRSNARDDKNTGRDSTASEETNESIRKGRLERWKNRRKGLTG